MTVAGPANSTTVKALEKITYPDGSFTKFEYNGYVQVKKISQVAADSTSHILNYVSTNLDSISGSQTDCPRLSETRSWVENFNLNGGGVPQEVVVTNSLTTGASYSLPNSISGSATRIDVGMTGHPDGLYSRIYVGASGWNEGLTIATEDCTGSNCATRLRWTWNDWTQDNERVNNAIYWNLGVASASSYYPYGSLYHPSRAIDGERIGYSTVWMDNTPNAFPDWLQIAFDGSKSIDEIDVFTRQDNPPMPSDPTESMTFANYGITAFDVQYWDGSSWVTVTGGSITNNNKVWRKITFSPITTSKIRILVNNGGGAYGYSTITEVEAWGPRSYILNPRVEEVRVGDGTNTKKTTIGYGSNGFGLPEEVKIYDTDLSTVLKTQTTSYSSSPTYLDRRIIGLPTETKLYQGDTNGTLMSKVTYAYDEGSLTGTDPVQNISPTQHDNANFSSSYTTRGNLTTVKRWDVLGSSGLETKFKYNTAGAVVSKEDPLSHIIKIGYADDFNSSSGGSTYAYPTVITDQAGTSLGDTNHSSTVKYRYDTGANVEATSPAPTGQSYGKTSKRIYDSVGRLERNSIYVNTTEKAYTRYEYPTDGVQLLSFTPLVDADGDGNLPEDEVLTNTMTDGAGRVRYRWVPHTFDSNGNTATWAATISGYDILGRVSWQSVPTEINGSWIPTGDDATRSWIWNHTFYDWKDRVVRTVPSDSNGSDGKDTLISYAGCGCAGGLVTTVQGPQTDAVNVSGTLQTAKRRTQKVYEDILGRTYKTEIWDLDGAGSAPYSTTKTTFNGRDQATLIRQYQGSDSSSTYQDTTMSYDGHGRLYQSHKPEQRDGSNNPTYTTYAYNTDDSVASLADGRGVVTSYTYNSRKLVTNITWNVGGTGVADPTDVGLTYDNVGNRTAMTDGLGSVAYTYNSLSQMTDETRSFTETLDDAPLSSNSFKLEYTYTLSGALNLTKTPTGRRSLTRTISPEG